MAEIAGQKIAAPVFSFRVKCSEAITPSGCPLKVDSDGRVSISDAATDSIVGIASETTSAANAYLTMYGMYVRARAGGTVNEGSYVTSESGGRLIATTTDTQNVVGVSLEAAADGDLFFIAYGLSRYAG